ncbi:MAG: PRC-barrel domain-containing protein [Bauldia sp.]|nr:PRC-barrel domain-containing protein [Bauldia sp.]
MKTLLTTTALVALLSAAPVFAADDAAPRTDQAIEQMTTEAPAATDEMAPDASTDTVANDQVAPVTDGTAHNETYIPTQASEEDLASSWIGKSVYNESDENLGDINDLLLGEDGKIRAVIVGVGGFLGIGEKDVAVSFDAIKPRADADGDVTIYLAATQEQLESAPDFETLAEARARGAEPAATQ